MSKPRVALIVLLFFLFVLVGKTTYDYAAPPLENTDCDETKPTQIIVDRGDAPFEYAQKGGFINDASCLNKTPVYGIVNVSKEEDVSEALSYARANGLKVASAGQRHTMGGQSFVRDALVLDMRSLDRITVDSVQKTVRVQSGATWAGIQQELDGVGLSVKAMQSINIFTVGGTLSVNAHGIAHEPGQIAPTVRWMRVMLPDGTIKKASPTENAELFRSVLGGYGLFGVILEAELDVVENEAYARKTTYIDYKDFPAYYHEHIVGDDQLGLMYARLSVAPHSYLTETAIHGYTKASLSEPILPLTTETHTWLNRLVINFSKTGGFGRWVRWMLEKYLEPNIHSCISRNQAMNGKEVCIVSRNQEMYDSMGYLKNRLPDTDILQEYFIPPDRMTEFVDGLRTVVQENDANLLNVTIRIVHKDTITALPYAKDDRFAFVLYFNQKLNEQDSLVLQKTTGELIDLAAKLDGTFYLPYQLAYSRKQLLRAYPEAERFFAAKKRIDPQELLTNSFYERYGR